jgi:hypothetical protein
MRREVKIRGLNYIISQTLSISIVHFLAGYAAGFCRFSNQGQLLRCYDGISHPTVGAGLPL